MGGWVETQWRGHAVANHVSHKRVTILLSKVQKCHRLAARDGCKPIGYIRTAPGVDDFEQQRQNHTEGAYKLIASPLP